MLQKEEILALIDKQEPEMLALWEKLVRIETPTENKEGLEKLAGELEALFDQYGFAYEKTEFPKAGPTLVANVKGDDLAPIIFMSHMDTVHTVGAFGDNAWVIDSENPDIVHGPGVSDTKGGVVSALYAMKVLKEIGYSKRPLKLILVGDEEVAHAASEGAASAIIEREVEGAACAFNCDSGRLDRNIAVKRNGGGIFKVTVHGKAAHAGNAPWEGANAILAASKKIAAIAELSDYNDAYFGTGVIKGGSKSNIVPDYCEFINDIRFKTNAAYDGAVAKIKAVCENDEDARIKTEVKVVGCFRAMEKVEKTDAFFDIYKNVCVELGYPEPQAVEAGGCSDASFVAYKNVPVLCGTGSRGANNHSLEEYAILSSVAEQVKKMVLTVLAIPDNF